MIKILKIIAFLFFSSSLAYGSEIKLEKINEYKIKSNKNYLKDFSALNTDGSINVVIEIPAGTNAKWEVSKDNGFLEWEFKNNKPRVVNYLPYPANYGMIPSTIQSYESGGDGDPIDVILLGDALERGLVIKAKPIGVIKMLDDGEVDDKILAIAKNSIFYSKVEEIDDLWRYFNGTLEILKIWFENYKGIGEIQVTDIQGSKEAIKIINNSISKN